MSIEKQNISKAERRNTQASNKKKINLFYDIKAK